MGVLDAVRLMVDAALVVLVWLVQMIIYPSFRHMEEKSFNSWHPSYMRSMTFIVFPLMLTQLVVYSIEILLLRNLVFLASFGIVILLWVHTLVFAAPLHRNFGRHSAVQQQVSKLIQLNWWRVAGWSLIWISSVYLYLK